MAGFDIPEGTQFFIVPETGTGPDHPFSGEKLTVTMALYRVKDIDEAIALTNRIQAYQGQGHSCGIYSRSDANIMKLAEAHQHQPGDGQPAAGRLQQRQSVERHAPDLLARLRLSWGGNGTNNNITWRDLINETWVSKPLAVPTAICGTDMHIYNWDEWAQKTIPVPMVVGHEYVGEIVDIGARSRLRGRRPRLRRRPHHLRPLPQLPRRPPAPLPQHGRRRRQPRRGASPNTSSIPRQRFKIPDGITDEIASIFDPFGNATHTALRSTWSARTC
jgi:hypothetical protein